VETCDVQDRISVEPAINGWKEGLSFTNTDVMIPSEICTWYLME